MGSLVKDLPISEMVATLEIFDQLGVTRAGLRRFRRAERNDKEEVARLIQLGPLPVPETPKERRRLTPLVTIEVGGVSKVHLLERSNINDRWGDTDWSGLIVETVKSQVNLVSLRPADFGFARGAGRGLIFDQQWLDKWSKTNLDGQSLEPCTVEDVFQAHLNPEPLSISNGGVLRVSSPLVGDRRLQLTGLGAGQTCIELFWKGTYPVVATSKVLFRLKELGS